MQQIDLYLENLSNSFFQSDLKFDNLELTNPTQLEEKLLDVIRCHNDKISNLNLVQNAEINMQRELEEVKRIILLQEERIGKLEKENLNLKSVLTQVFE